MHFYKKRNAGMVRTAKQQPVIYMVMPLLVSLLGTPAAVDAGAWTLPSGRVWTKISWFQQTTNEWYIDTPEPVLLPNNTFSTHPIGSRRPYRFNGEYV